MVLLEKFLLQLVLLHLLMLLELSPVLLLQLLLIHQPRMLQRQLW